MSAPSYYATCPVVYIGTFYFHTCTLRCILSDYSHPSPPLGASSRASGFPSLKPSRAGLCGRTALVKFEIPSLHLCFFYACSRERVWRTVQATQRLSGHLARKSVPTCMQPGAAGLMRQASLSSSWPLDRMLPSASSYRPK